MHCMTAACRLTILRHPLVVSTDILLLLLLLPLLTVTLTFLSVSHQHASQRGGTVGCSVASSTAQAMAAARWCGCAVAVLFSRRRTPPPLCPTQPRISSA